jgi:glycerol-3-phosphate dehydrogenase (NAD(P)+)
MMGNQLKGLVTLIGPSFAVEVFKNEPTMVNTISTEAACSRMVSLLFNNNHFKCVNIKDEVGAEIIGALKNVAAIAMGLAYELHASINTRAAMLAQATKEISNVVKYYGGEPETITQFCGIGDIYLTCTDEKSRNFSFGKQIAKVGVKQALLNNKTTIEGYYAAEVIYKVIKKAKMNAPIFTKLHEVLFENDNPKTFVKQIMKEIIE